VREITGAAAEFTQAQLTVRGSFSARTPETNLSADALSVSEQRDFLSSTREVR